ncbi:hypothetical protein [Streptomyces sp. NPDC014733]|uniref:hypothetical protein n=1 Tax=Streptomyces sp. NPDC014733 TaxID=3364885 RepID=UPI0036FEB995
MHLRRTLSASAATAALLPLTLAAAPASQAAPAGKLPSCSDVGKPHEELFVTRTFGVPHTVAPGGPWATYTATITNVSTKELKPFQLTGSVGSYVYNEGERDLSPYADLQYRDTAQSAWKTLRNADGDAVGAVPGPKTLKPRESVHVQLRFRLHKDLPLDQTYDAHTGLTGTFVDHYNDTDCAETGDAFGSFSPTEG